MAKQGLECDYQYDWIIKKEGGKMPAMYDEKKPLAGQPAQKPPQANRQSQNNMQMKMINDYEERKEQRANAGV